MPLNLSVCYNSKFKGLTLYKNKQSTRSKDIKQRYIRIKIK